MKTLRNKIAKNINGLTDIQHDLFFQSLTEKEKKDFYKAQNALNELFITVNVKIKH